METEDDRLIESWIGVAETSSQQGIGDKRGTRALLLYPPGLDYLAAFFRMSVCGSRGGSGVSTSQPTQHLRIKGDRIRRQAAIILTTSIIESQVRSLLEPETGSDNVQWLTTDNLAQEPKMLGKNLYSSGYLSISAIRQVPREHRKGQCSVMATLHNAAMTYRVMAHSPTVSISWLPAYHDMGLIGGILQPLYGVSCILMPPAVSPASLPLQAIPSIKARQAVLPILPMNCAFIKLHQSSSRRWT